MHFLIEKAQKYGVNRTPQDERNFYSICDSENIEIIWSGGKFSWYMTIDCHPFIVLPKRRRGIKLLFDMFHELGHHFAHNGDAADQVFFSGLKNDKAEFEADAFSIISICPITVLQGQAEFVEETKFARAIRTNRDKLYFLYGV